MGEVIITDYIFYSLYEIAFFLGAVFVMGDFFRANLHERNLIFTYLAAVLGVMLFALGRDMANLMGYPIQSPFVWWHVEMMLRGWFLLEIIRIIHRRIKFLFSLYHL